MKPSDPQPAGFQKFWAAYPRRVGLGAALRAWKNNDCEPIADDIVKVVKRYQFSTDKSFVPHPSTFLNQWRWMDEENISKGVQDDW